MSSFDSFSSLFGSVILPASSDESVGTWPSTFEDSVTDGVISLTSSQEWLFDSLSAVSIVYVSVGAVYVYSVFDSTEESFVSGYFSFCKVEASLEDCSP